MRTVHRHGPHSGPYSLFQAQLVQDAAMLGIAQQLDERGYRWLLLATARDNKVILLGNQRQKA